MDCYTNYAAAAEGGHLSCLQWLRENGCNWDGDTSCSDAARNGHLHIFKWARQNGCLLSVMLYPDVLRYVVLQLDTLLLPYGTDIHLCTFSLNK